MNVVLAVAVASVVALFVPAAGRGQLRRLDSVVKPGKASGWGMRIGLVVVGFVVIGLVGGLRMVGWAVVCAVAGATLAGLAWRAGRARRLARQRSEVARAARTMASQLRIGQIPVAALREAAADCEVIRPAAEASRMGGDVGGELRAAADRPGCDGLWTLASAWDLGVTSGAPVAGLVSEVADRLRDEDAVRAGIAAEVAGARTAGRVLAVLPLAGVGLGYFGGGDPLGYLTTTTIGQWLCIGGVVWCAVGVVWMERMADKAEIARL